MDIINHKEMEERLEFHGDMVLIDVLPEESYQQEHLPGAVNIPYNDENFIAKVENYVMHKNDEIVVYCAHKECTASDKAAEKLQEAGYKNVADFEGGLKEWKKAGHQLHNGQR